jgi:LPXTG-site transpeptidase (sortase) family protein
LDQLTAGATVLVYTERNVYTYTIREQAVVEPTDISVAYSTAAPQLTLITCSVWDSGKKTYTKRRAAFADLLSVVPLN